MFRPCHEHFRVVFCFTNQSVHRLIRATTQPDHNFCCPLTELFTKHSKRVADKKTLLWLCGCAGSSESSLFAYDNRFTSLGILIGLWECAGWRESLLFAYDIIFVLHIWAYNKIATSEFIAYMANEGADMPVRHNACCRIVESYSKNTGKKRTTDQTAIMVICVTTLSIWHIDPFSSSG